MSRHHRRDRQMRNWARGVVTANTHVPPLDLVEAVADRVDQALKGTGGVEATVPQPFGSTPVSTVFDSVPPEGWADPWLPGIVHEQAVSAERRAARGAWYTPQSVVVGLVRLALAAVPQRPGFTVDPTCGGGAFLLAVLDQLVAGGVDAGDAVSMVAGRDIDPDAVAVTRRSIGLWASGQGLDLSPAEIDVTVGDALHGQPDHWPPVELVVGNPPFASPLRSGAVPARAAAFRQDRDELLGPYADLAAIHLQAAIEHNPDAVIALVQPQSVLAGRDTAGLRSRCHDHAPLLALWAAREAVFDAGVRACGLVLRPGVSAPTAVMLAAGPDVERCGEVAADGAGQPSWSSLAAVALGGPDLPPTMPAPAEEGRPMSSSEPPAGSATTKMTSDAGHRLGSLATATAGFRDEYYGLVAACREWDGKPGTEPNRLVTVGAVEPLTTLWGHRPTKFGGRSWLRPHIDLDALDQKVLTWTKRQLKPKVVLATQSRILEPVVDRTGQLIPATPLVAVHAEPDDLDRVASVLLAPPVVAWAWQQWFGTALAVDALKLAARQVAWLPLPLDRGAWAEAVALLATDLADDGGTDDGTDHRAALAWDRSCAVAMLMNRAYGADQAVYQWWLERSRRSAPASTAAGRGG